MEGSRPLGQWATAGVIAAMAFAIALAGDACHVASGTTHYEWSGWPTIWKSDLWFPLLPTVAIVLGAWTVERLGLPAVRRRGRADAVTGAALVLALYALTAAIRSEPETVQVVLISAIAVAIWSWWDPSPGTLAVAALAAILGPLVEIGFEGLGAFDYASDSDSLAGVAPWLPGLYFAAGAVAARLWGAISRDGAAISRQPTSPLGEGTSP